MKKLFSSKKFCRVLILLVLVYTIVVFFSQNKKLASYDKQKSYYQSQIADLEEEQAELLEEQSNINSPEYIESQAREKLDMYYPNERVYKAK